MMNRSYGRLTDGVLTFAPVELTIDGRIHINPSAENYASCGWTPVDASPAPTPRYGYHYEADGWEDRDGAIRRVWREVANPTTYRAWTPLTIMRAAKAANVWDALKDALDGANAYDEFAMCQYVAECDAAYGGIYAVLKASLGDAVDTFVDGLKVERTGTQEELCGDAEEVAEC